MSATSTKPDQFGEYSWWIGRR